MSLDFKADALDFIQWNNTVLLKGNTCSSDLKKNL